MIAQDDAVGCPTNKNVRVECDLESKLIRKRNFIFVLQPSRHLCELTRVSLPGS